MNLRSIAGFPKPACKLAYTITSDLLLRLFSLTYSTGSGTSRPVPVPPTEHEFVGDCLVLRDRVLNINSRIFGLEQELRRNKRKCYMVTT